MSIQFIPLTEQHIPEVLSIYNWYVDNSTATFHTEPISVNEMRSFLHVNHPIYQSFIILYKSSLAGYCYLTNHKPRQAYNRTAEITIYLKQEFHNNGIGKAAIRYLENLAKTLGIKNLVAGISGDNLGSIALFEKAGFIKCAHYKNVGEKFGKILDVVAYQKEL